MGGERRRGEIFLEDTQFINNHWVVLYILRAGFSPSHPCLKIPFRLTLKYVSLIS